MYNEITSVKLLHLASRCQFCSWDKWALAQKEVHQLSPNDANDANDAIIDFWMLQIWGSEDYLSGLQNMIYVLL